MSVDLYNGGGGGWHRGAHIPYPRFFTPQYPISQIFYPQYPISQIFYPPISHIPDVCHPPPPPYNLTILVSAIMQRDGSVLSCTQGGGGGASPRYFHEYILNGLHSRFTGH